MGTKVYFQSLGCPKNLVDSEIMLGLLTRDGAEIVLDPRAADVYVVNTCGFIGPAKQESIEAILDLSRLKQADPSRRLIVTGCLAQRYGGELHAALPEVDGFLGTGDFDRLPDVVARRSGSDAWRYGGAAHLLPDRALPRLRTGPFFSAYLKVSEGCNHRCSFCIIPKIRGSHQSRPLDDVLIEAEALAADGVVELNLIAQDLTAYGRDLRDGATLARLLRELAGIRSLRWIRLLYAYPNYVDAELLGTIASEEKVCPYIDMPLQHVSDRVLRRMRRERSSQSIRRLIARIREAVPGVALRSAFIVGFPGESEEDFSELVGFVREAEFERVGVFEYSAEEGTEAVAFADQVPEATKRRRFHALMRTQAEVAQRIHRMMVGTQQLVLVCGEDDQGRPYGRLATQAPDIDGVVYLDTATTLGSIVPARITRADTYDLHASVEMGSIDTPAEGPYSPLAQTSG